MPLLVEALTVTLGRDARELTIVACAFFLPLVKNMSNCKIVKLQYTLL